MFQPIVDAHSGEVRGQEAFLRVLGHGQPDLSPWGLFSAAADDERLIALDRLCRTVHLLNWLLAASESLLFLNVHGRLLAAVADDHGRAFRRVVDALGVSPERLVIETPVAASRQPELLHLVLRNYRRHGFQVAVNLESPAHWPAITRSAPQFVKLAMRSSGWDDHLDGAVLGDLLHCSGRETVVVLTRNERPLAGTLPGRVWLQGHAYGSPRSCSPDAE
ncbi:EAL domain-containing protein [Accumulibacter sp.]|uniref:EAL domain-containing protein n=1 Tax=Accumulibacter sp. TaxID=2053492 RepID=UPI0034243F87|nr:EAL domain-containing protein [Accumulibacter sp.]